MSAYEYKKLVFNLHMPIIRLDPESRMGRELQTLQTVYYAMIAVPLVLFLLLYLEVGQPQFRPYMVSDAVLWLHILIWLGVVIVAAWAYRRYLKRMKEGIEELSLERRFARYLKESRGLYVLLALLMLLPVLAIWLTGAQFYGILFTLLIILIAAVRPTADQFVQKAYLTNEQKEELARIS